MDKRRLLPQIILAKRVVWSVARLSNCLGKGRGVSPLMKGEDTRKMVQSQVNIQITPEPSPSTPSWMGEVVAFAMVLPHFTCSTFASPVRKEKQKEHMFASGAFS
jgi:hypothetical protein